MIKTKSLFYGACEFKIQRLNDTMISREKLVTPEKVVEFLTRVLPESVRFNRDVENFIVLFLDTQRKIIGFDIVSQGILDTLLVHPREVFKSAIVMNSAAIILAHNHPSGEPSPSEADIRVTRDLIRAGQLLKIEVLDHVVLGQKSEESKGWASLRELGYFYS